MCCFKRQKVGVKNMRIWIMCLLTIALVGIAGCVDMNETALQVENETVQITSGGQNYPTYVVTARRHSVEL
jgi:hypothetical protein